MASREKRDTGSSLDGIFRPRSVAVLGASRHAASIGHMIVANLVESGFTGPVYPVNPKADVVRSMRCYASLGDVPDRVDLAVVVVPAARVVSVARACGRKGVRGLVVISAGFREIGAAGRAREAKLVAVAERYGMRIIGPNCMGVIHTDTGFSLNATFAAAPPIPGPVAFVSQSGALGEAILADAREAGLGIRMFASVGNRADVGAHDLCEYWEQDDGVRLILLYLESFGNPERFKAVAERLRGVKPIIALKAGRSEAGARAAGSHTGSIAGADITVDTFLAQCGVLRASSMRQMFSFARALLHQPTPAGDGVAVVTNAGGPGILATDALAGCGLELAGLSDATIRRLRRVLPPEATAQNPLDLIASADAARYREALAAVAKDARVHALLVMFVSPIMIDAEAVARAILEVAAKSRKPAVACIMGRERGDEARALLEGAGIPVFRFPEEAASTLAGLIRYRSLSERPSGECRRFRVRRAAAARVVATQQRRRSEWFDSAAGRELLTAYGLPVIPTLEAGSEGAAVTAARRLGYPVCLKATAAGLVHKSDLGGVRLALRSEDEVRQAARAIQRRIGRRFRDLRLEVQPMAPGHREMLIGLKRDRRFGPLFAIGFGGVTVEVLRDVSVRIGPLRDEDPARMLAELRGAALLQRFRGEPPVDQEALGECLLRLNQLAGDFPTIAEVDLNPVIAAATGVPTWIVDARVRWCKDAAGA